MTLKKSRRLVLIVVAATAMTLLAAGWALATHFTGHVTSTGTGQVSQTNQSSTVFTTITSTSFSTLNGTQTTVVVPTGQTRLVNARWVGTANAQNGFCSMRIGTIKGASFTAFNPAAGSQLLLRGGSSFVNGGGQAMERSRRLTAGTYTVVAELAKGLSSTTCNVDDWHFAVQVIG